MGTHKMYVVPYTEEGLIVSSNCIFGPSLFSTKLYNDEKSTTDTTIPQFIKKLLGDKANELEVPRIDVFIVKDKLFGFCRYYSLIKLQNKEVSANEV